MDQFAKRREAENRLVCLTSSVAEMLVYYKGYDNRRLKNVKGFIKEWSFLTIVQTCFDDATDGKAVRGNQWMVYLYLQTTYDKIPQMRGKNTWD